MGRINEFGHGAAQQTEEEGGMEHVDVLRPDYATEYPTRPYVQSSPGVLIR